jgi:hypothetical protein
MYGYGALDDVDRKKQWMRDRMAESVEELLKREVPREELAQLCVELVLKWRFARGYVAQMVRDLDSGELEAEDVVEAMRMLEEVIGEPPAAWAGMMPETEAR